MSVLEAYDLSIRFGGVQANRDVSVAISEWEIVGIIGPNGAGKTTLFNLITGFYKPDSGRVILKGVEVTDVPVHHRDALVALQHRDLALELVREPPVVGVEKREQLAACFLDGAVACARATGVLLPHDADALAVCNQDFLGLIR